MMLSVTLLYLKISQDPPVFVWHWRSVDTGTDDSHPNSQPDKVSHKVIKLQHSCDTKGSQWARGLGCWMTSSNKLTIFLIYNLGRGGGTIWPHSSWLYIKLNKTNIKANNIYPLVKAITNSTLRFLARSLLIVVRLVNLTSFAYTFSLNCHLELSTISLVLSDLEVYLHHYLQRPTGVPRDPGQAYQLG